MRETEAFYKLAREYCDYVRANEISRDSVPFLMALLMRLYMSAQALPDLAMDGEDAPQTDLNSEFAIRLQAARPICGSRRRPDLGERPPA